MTITTEDVVSVGAVVVEQRTGTRWAPGFSRLYRRHVVEWTRRLELKGLVTAPAHPIELAAVIAVIGLPGSGKTTLVRHVAVTLARRRRAVPVLLELRRYAGLLDGLDEAVDSAQARDWVERQV